MKAGKVYLTGGGCGGAELLTLKALEALRRCDVVVYDSLVSEELLLQTRPDCEKIYAGKRFGSHTMKQAQINALLADKALEGKIVVRLKGGDPYVFGRGGEEFLALREAGICCEEIPGISSAIAVPAAAGIPVTHRGMAADFTVVTGTAAGDEEGPALDFETLAGLRGTLVILMGMHHLDAIAAGLMKAGKSPDTPCAIIMEGTTGRQRCMRAALSQLCREAAEKGFTSPAVIVIGAVAALALTAASVGTVGERGKQADGKDESANNGLPLAGVTVGVTGTPHFAGRMSAALTKKGAQVRDMSFLEILPTADPLPQLEAFGWLVFTSPNGVRVFLDKMRRERRDMRTLFGRKIAVIGPGTAEALAQAGIYADYMPETYDAPHLARGLAEKILAEGRETQALFLRARQGSEQLPRIFDERGISFREYPLYELAVQAERRTLLTAGEADYIVFGSAMGVRAFFEGPESAGSAERKSRYVCIGEACAEELRRKTDAPCLVAEEAGIEAMVACLCKDHERWTGERRWIDSED